jgi:hypothetical protein
MTKNEAERLLFELRDNWPLRNPQSLFWEIGDGVWQVVLRLDDGNELPFYIQPRDGRFFLELGRHDAPKGTWAIDANAFAQHTRPAEGWCTWRPPPGVSKITGDRRITLLRWLFQPLPQGTRRLFEERAAYWATQSKSTSARVLSRDEGAEIFRRGQRAEPVVVRGLAPAWGIKELRERFGAELEPTTQQPLEAFLTAMTSVPSFKVGSIGTPAAMLTELGILRPFSTDRALATYGFYTGGGGISNIHRDAFDGLSVVFGGPRHFMLFSPDQNELVYGYGSFSGDYEAACINPARPNLEKFPRFADAVCTDVILAAGDALLLPAGWFHQVSSQEGSMCLRYDLPHDWHEAGPS